MRNYFLLGLMAGLLCQCANQPTARITEMRLRELTPDKVKVDMDLEVTNHYRQTPLPLLNFKNRLVADNRQIYQSSLSAPDWAVPPNDSRTLRTQAELNFGPLIQTIGQHYQRGTKVPYAATMNLSWKSPTGEVFEFPELKDEGSFPLPKFPEVALRKVPDIQVDLGSGDNFLTPHVDETRQGKLTGTLFLNVKNTNGYAVRLKKIRGTLKAVKPFSTDRVKLAEVLYTDNQLFSAGQTRNVEVDFQAAILNPGDTFFLTIAAFTDPDKFQFRGEIELEIDNLPVKFSF